MVAQDKGWTKDQLTAKGIGTCEAAENILCFACGDGFTCQVIDLYMLNEHNILSENHPQYI